MALWLLWSVWLLLLLLLLLLLSLLLLRRRGPPELSVGVVATREQRAAAGDEA